MAVTVAAIAAPVRRLMPRSRRDLRLASGLVLFTYVALHLSCHALGLVSLGVAEAALRFTVLLWHSPPGTLLLYGAAAVHVFLALRAVYERRTLRMPPQQALRIALGLAMPITLIGHFIATRYAFERFGLPAEYSRVAAGLWARGASGLALGLLAPGWIHGCLGLRFAFGHRPGWQRLRPVLFATALLLPVLAAVGFVTMGRELAATSSSDPYSARTADVGQQADLQLARNGALLAYFGFLVWVGLGRTWRGVAERTNKSVVWISYPGRTVSVPRGWTVLEASRSFGIPHQAMCGGRARCTTCRVSVVSGESHCPAPTIDERRALDRIAPSKPNVRLACQLRPTGDIGVELILGGPPRGHPAAGPPLRATDHDAALLLFEVRIDTSSTAPGTSGHDTIYALGQCLSVVEAAAVGSGAALYRQSASSWMLVFRDDANLAAAAGRALAVADRIAPEAERLSASLAGELGLRVRSSLVLHAGRVAVGSIGSGATAVAGRPVEEIEGMRAQRPGSGTSFTLSKEAAAMLGVAAGQRAP